MDEAGLIDLLKSLPVSEIRVGDAVEFTSGPFRGECAKILKIDGERGELTVELESGVRVVAGRNSVRKPETDKTGCQ
jgi:transcription antitermination factor NusG